MFDSILENILQAKPLVHTITNFVTVNDCANIILASGGSPTMSHHPAEVEEITEGCQSLVLNMGAIEDKEAMLLAGRRSNQMGHPIILDPVAAGASKLRADTAMQLLGQLSFSVIRGNISEIKSLTLGVSSAKGVDADELDLVTEENLPQAVALAQTLSKKTSAVIVISGKLDIVADATHAYVIRNGNAIMSRITGTGCMLTALIGAYCGANPTRIFDAAAAAVAAMGVCGELAYQKMLQNDGGTLSFRTYLIDYISNLNTEQLIGGTKLERYKGVDATLCGH